MKEIHTSVSLAASNSPSRRCRVDFKNRGLRRCVCFSPKFFFFTSIWHWIEASFSSNSSMVYASKLSERGGSTWASIWLRAYSLVTVPDCFGRVDTTFSCSVDSLTSENSPFGCSMAWYLRAWAGCNAEPKWGCCHNSEESWARIETENKWNEE